MIHSGKDCGLVLCGVIKISALWAISALPLHLIEITYASGMTNSAAMDQTAPSVRKLCFSDSAWLRLIKNFEKLAWIDPINMELLVENAVENMLIARYR